MKMWWRNYGKFVEESLKKSERITSKEKNYRRTWK